MAAPAAAGRRLAALAVLAVLAGAGCFDDPTQVVVAVDTDARVGTDFSGVAFLVSTPQFQQRCALCPSATSDGHAWPVTLAVAPGDGVPNFTVEVQLTIQSPTQQVFSTRTAKDVRFVPGQRSVLFIPMLRSCACVDAAGMPITSCARALDPDCVDFSNPPLGELDEDNLPHLPAAAKAP